MHKQTLVVKSNIHFLVQGIELLSSITDDQYSQNDGKYFKSGIGRHFRHIIEHYQSLVEGYTNKVNYDDRKRDIRIETDRSHAIHIMRGLVDSLEHFIQEPGLIDKKIEVQSNEGVGEEGTPWSNSSIRRELQFLISHTVHHYALIAIILRTVGFEPGESFGVAPSTLKYEQKSSDAKAS